jgi:hypothetical protein
MHRRCWDCEQTKDEESFSFKDKAAGKRQTRCKECVRAYRIAHYAKSPGKERADSLKRNHEIRQRLFNIALRKKLVPCKDCGCRQPPWSMQFDHLEGSEKVGHISRMITMTISESRLLAEITKCEVVCASCHTDRTARRRFSTMGFGRFGPLMEEIKAFLEGV